MRYIKCDRMHGSCVYICAKIQGSSKESVEKWCTMENHIIIGLFRGNKVMVQKNRMKEIKTTNQNKEVE